MASIMRSFGASHVLSQNTESEHTTITRWKAASKKQALHHKIKDIAIGVLYGIGILFVVLGGLTPPLHQYFIDIGRSVPHWTFFSFFGFCLLGGGILILAEKLRKKHCVWVNYKDRKQACEVIQDFKKGAIVEIANKYQGKIPELIRWGILPEKMGSGSDEKDIAKELGDIFQITSLLQDIERLEKRQGDETAVSELAEKSTKHLTLNQKWVLNYKDKITSYLPQFPEIFPENYTE